MQPAVDSKQSEVKQSSKFWDVFKRYNLLILILLFVALAASLSPKFLTVQNFLNLLQQSSVIGIVSIGMTFVIIVAGIDLGVGSVVAFAGMIAAVLLAGGHGLVISIGVALLAGMALGSINGFLTTKAKVPAFIVTLAMMVAARGLALLVTDGRPVFNLPAAFNWLGAGFIGPFPVSGLLWLLITLIAVLVLTYTTFGRSLYAIGGNAESARLSGIRVERNIIIVFAISGMLSALAGVVLASWLTVGQPTAAKGLELDAIAAVVLGGTNLFGGSGGVLGTFGGVWLMAIITNIFNLLGLSSYYQMIFMGLIIVAALILNQFVANRD
ncbi:ABC transporter permease [Metallumcola ferriviriculae]|uniref:ABC transporter permease n=1 Tax=Metallumcola ferriviriculae TaxID=3039180 RepID=A0AAU0UR01_9FIRM|nr:ABC transporter permease [Desulfitibacteraceae bacterium MK1]